MKDVVDFEGLYKVTEDGKIYGVKSQKWRTPYISKTSAYLYIDLWNCGKRYKKSVHRIVADAYIPNPQNKPVIDHINNDIRDNRASNLQWVTQKENIHKSYETMSAIRNFCECKLMKDNVCLGKFKSFSECCRYASEEYGLSYSMLLKHKKYKEYYIMKV